MGRSEFIGLGSTLVNHAGKKKDPIIRFDLGLSVYVGLNSGQSDLILGLSLGRVGLAISSP